VPNPGCLFIGHGPNTRLLGSPETRSLIFLIKNSPDQVEGCLDYLQPHYDMQMKEPVDPVEPDAVDQDEEGSPSV
jgi:hypothetical protein